VALPEVRAHGEAEGERDERGADHRGAGRDEHNGDTLRGGGRRRRALVADERRGRSRDDAEQREHPERLDPQVVA